MLGDHQPPATTRDGGSRKEDVQVVRPLPLPPSQESSDLCALPDPTGPRKPESLWHPSLAPTPRLASRRATPGPPVMHRRGNYLEPMVTERVFRPRRRRRLRVLRPPRVFMRARNPCLLLRLRFRGRYVGFIGYHLQSDQSARVEQAKIPLRRTTGQDGHALYLPGMAWPHGRIDFSTPQA